MKASDFVDTIAGMQFVDVFNPYAQVCDVHDRPDAPEIRRDNLRRVVEAAVSTEVETFWIARDLGYRGGRRTGLALTDETHLSVHADIMRIDTLRRSTVGPAVQERTATVIWTMLRELRQPVFLWNVFPLHPHVRNDPLSNRCHTKAEREACRALLDWLLSTLRPRSVVAIGRDAQASLLDLGVRSTPVRHPSYGGQTEFVAGVREHYGLPRVKDMGQQLSIFGS